MLASFILLWVCIYFIVLQVRCRRPQNFPPGPTALPMVGNLLNLSLDNPLGTLRGIYGDVYSLYIGLRPAVIVSGATDFAGRPQDLFVNETTEGKGVILVDYGPGWKEHRRFALMTLRNFEIQYIIATLEKSIGSTLNPQLMFHNASSNIICQVLFGTRFNYDDEFIKVIVQCSLRTPSWPTDPGPIFYCFLSQICQRLSINLVTEHKKTRVPGKPRDFIDCYLDELEKVKNDGSSFSEEQLVMYALDLHFAGTDTTSNTLLTGFLYLMTHPQIQERCQQEIDQVLEGKDQASFEDRHNMPYTQVQGRQPVPLSVFHCTTKDTELRGYSIPRGTMIIPNLTSVLNEEGQWKHPHEFNPDNFLNDQGDFVKPEAFMPFSVLVCLGEGLARMELFLITVTLLRTFKFLWPEDAGEPDYTPVYGVTLTPRPYRMKIQLRASQ
uniref:Cytochrome P450, family 2, subfamily X, polypeptide 9 n=1 Tax=Sphaeramia orbicularis TaxID=375764 RepID=A0A672YDF2_9TELE